MITLYWNQVPFHDHLVLDNSNRPAVGALCYTVSEDGALGHLGTALRTRSRDLGIAACLLLLVLGVYAPVRHFDFIILDDPSYVSSNNNVLLGLSPDSLRWAFTSTGSGNWHPLTWISLMADCEFFGTGAGSFHITNLALHAASSLLLFALLKRMTGASGPSALVAFLFALHALHVESVAWVSERKDVLSGLFWMLTLWAYVRYVSRPHVWNYVLALSMFLLGLASKPMLVSLPLVLLLLDIWPLHRLSRAPGKSLRQQPALRLIGEKVPFFALAGAISVTTFVMQRRLGFMQSLDALPLGTRLGNAVLSAAIYIEKTLWPARLAVFYPLPAKQPVWTVILAGMALAGVTLLVLRLVRTRPYLAVGWFWYLLTVLPVIGIVQVGEQARADRYTYIPTIGIFLILGWGGLDIWRRLPGARPLLAGICALACVACVSVTSRQVRYWQNSATLLQHTIAVTKDNAFAYLFLGNAAGQAGFHEVAIAHYRRALEINPRVLAALMSLGGSLIAVGRSGEAIPPLTELVRLQPGGYLNHQNLGLALAGQGRKIEALDQFETAARLKPNYADAHIALGSTLADLGRFDEAVAQFLEALRIDPDNMLAVEDLHAAQEKRELESGRVVEATRKR